MPNWASNTLTFRGKKAELEAMLSAYLTDGNLDFEKIIAKPDGFDAELASGSGDDAADIAYGDANSAVVQRYLTYQWAIDKGITTAEQLREYMAADYAKRAAAAAEAAESTADPWSAKLLAQFTQYPTYQALADAYLRNVQLSGCKTWYDWNSQHWGTKWNAVRTHVHRHGDDEIVLTFDTAWCEPLPVIEALAERHPTVFVEYLTRYEDGGFSGNDYNEGYEETDASQ